MIKWLKRVYEAYITKKRLKSLLKSSEYNKRCNIMFKKHLDFWIEDAKSEKKND
jgi:hypothetical protein